MKQDKPSSARTLLRFFRVLGGFILTLALAGGVFSSCGNDLTPKDAHPVATDFNIGELTHTFSGKPKTVEITPKQGSSTGTITVYYQGIGYTDYRRNIDAPSVVGTYTALPLTLPPLQVLPPPQAYPPEPLPSSPSPMST